MSVKRLTVSCSASDAHSASPLPAPPVDADQASASSAAMSTSPPRPAELLPGLAPLLRQPLNATSLPFGQPLNATSLCLWLVLPLSDSSPPSRLPSSSLFPLAPPSLPAFCCCCLLRVFGTRRASSAARGGRPVFSEERLHSRWALMDSLPGKCGLCIYE